MTQHTPRNGFFVTVTNCNTGNRLELHGPFDSANEAEAASIDHANENERHDFCVVDFAWYGPDIEPVEQ